MRALVEAVREGRLAADIRLVLSNRADAAGLAWAEEQGLPTLVMSHKEWPTRDAYDKALAEALQKRGIRFVCLAGFMRVLGPAFVGAFPNAIVNVHPSLLPSFPGVDAQRQAFDHGVKTTGVTVHFVDEALDAGPIIAQAAVAVRDDDTVETLSARVLIEEHRLLPAAVQQILTEPWEIRGRRVVFAPSQEVQKA
ncbi:MAG: phosphoribosylglycinamide formyltransferase [Acidimicrobiia bacterium]